MLRTTFVKTKYKMVNIDKCQTYTLPPNLACLGRQMVSVVSCPMAHMGCAKWQLPTIGCQIKVCFLQ